MRNPVERTRRADLYRRVLSGPAAVPAPPGAPKREWRTRTEAASDLDPLKLASLETEMQRLGITCVETGVLDATGPVRFDEAPLFDRILVDAPCTGLGVLQKNPDGKWRTRIDDIDTCARRQLRLLSTACEHLLPEGILVYAVCSMEPEENELLVRSFLQNHPEFVIHCPDITSVANARKLMTSEGFLRTQPHQHNMDGFFAAALRRRAG